MSMPGSPVASGSRCFRLEFRAFYQHYPRHSVSAFGGRHRTPGRKGLNGWTVADPLGLRGSCGALNPLPILMLALWLFLVGNSQLRAQDKIVLELFTSQGCPSCPPANALLERLSRQPDVIALTLNVSYWDYLGWNDTFAMPKSMARQKAYARARGARSLYTPQMVVDGQDVLVGHDTDAIQRSLERQRSALDSIVLEIEREAEMLRIGLTPLQELNGPFDIQVVRYISGASVTVGSGENAGKVLTYTNIVTDWETIAQWNGSEPLELRYRDLSDSGPLAVVVQESGAGPIRAAATLP